jgi:hypothetical protein
MMKEIYSVDSAGIDSIGILSLAILMSKLSLGKKLQEHTLSFLMNLN